MPSPPFSPVATWRFCWLRRRRKTCLPGMATSTTRSLATPRHCKLVSCRSGELAVRWMQATYLSMCVRPELRDECSGRFGTSWSFAGHCVHGKMPPHLSLFRKITLNARRMKLEHAEDLDRNGIQVLLRLGQYR